MRGARSSGHRSGPQAQAPNPVLGRESVEALDATSALSCLPPAWKSAGRRSRCRSARTTASTAASHAVRYEAACEVFDVDGLSGVDGDRGAET